MTERRLYNTDEQLLQGFRENDDRAWSIVLNDIDLRKMIFSLVIKNSGNEEDAIDVLQDALIVLCEKVKLGTFELSSKLSTYLYGIARNIWYKKLRTSGKALINMNDNYPDIPDIDEALLPYKNEPSGKLNKLSNALEEISEQCRNLLMAFYGGEKLNTLSEKFGYSSYESIKNNISKCRSKLKGAYNVQK